MSKNIVFGVPKTCTFEDVRFISNNTKHTISGFSNLVKERKIFLNRLKRDERLRSVGMATDALNGTTLWNDLN
ncbi:hypothetical protein Tcan_06828 [Toxocara canis]|uniref:Uncharacterized protein n=1 Tax=Toxocara canis TaxID=6265 RepID=A0A0B2VF09_TOXCA|nr:hypothetical protein Tcan_06828 [Toxocara canis]